MTSRAVHPLRALAVRLLDQWARETDPALADVATDGRPQSAWDNVRIGVAKTEGTTRRPGRRTLSGTTRVAATATRVPGKSKPPAGALDYELSPESRLVDGLMVLVAEISTDYHRAVWTTHLVGSQRDAADALGLNRDQVRRWYEAGAALFLRELIEALRARPRAAKLSSEERHAVLQVRTARMAGQPGVEA